MEVIIVGAGFSRAISDALPLGDELGNLAVAAAGAQSDRRIPPRGFRDGTFETWLSSLAEDQPHLREPENISNRALFARVLDGIASVLVERETLAFEAPAPPWLYELLSAVHCRRATVVSLNFDTMIEVAVRTHDLWDPDWLRVEGLDVLDDQPPRTASAIASRGVFVPSKTFRLLKLHGSLDWYWVPGDATGATINRSETLTRFGTPPLGSRFPPTNDVFGKERFIVPPLSGKSTYYRNPVTGGHWQLAFESLRRATRVWIVGYSLPRADTVVAGMLSQALLSSDVPIEIVNPRPKGVRSHLEDLGLEAARITTTEGDDCVEAFARAYCDHASGLVMGELQKQEPVDALLLVSWMRPPAPPCYRIASVERVGTQLELVAESPSIRRVNAFGARQDAEGKIVPESDGATDRELMRELDGAQRIVVRLPNHEVVTVVGVRPYGQDWDASVGKWIVFVPAGLPRSTADDLGRSPPG